MVIREIYTSWTFAMVYIREKTTSQYYYGLQMSAVFWSFKMLVVKQGLLPVLLADT